MGIILGPFVGGTQDQHQELESLAENGNLNVASWVKFLRAIRWPSLHMLYMLIML